MDNTKWSKKIKRKRKAMTPPPRQGLKLGRIGNEVGENSEERVVSALKLLQEKAKKSGSKVRISYIRRNTPHSSGDKKSQDVVVLTESGHNFKKTKWCSIQVKTSERGGKSFQMKLEKEAQELKVIGKFPKMIPKLIIAKEHDSIFEIMDKASKALGLEMSIH